MKFQKSAPLRGELSIPGDKSISHRAVMLGALARGTTEITNFLEGADCLSTIRCFRQMGIEISMEGDHVLVTGRGLDGLTPPGQVLDVGNSGTTMRLLSGILAGQTFSSTLDGDTSIRTRPMGRVTRPCPEWVRTSQASREMAARPCKFTENSFPPYAIRPLWPLPR